MEEIRESLIDIKNLVKKDDYPNLPDELKEFNYYVSDSGHCIVVVPECFLDEARQAGKDDLFDYEVPVPVKYVLEKGYKIIQSLNANHCVVNVEYDSIFGVVVPKEYDEF